jgi:hypothetical protein
MEGMSIEEKHSFEIREMHKSLHENFSFDQKYINLAPIQLMMLMDALLKSKTILPHANLLKRPLQRYHYKLLYGILTLQSLNIYYIKEQM